MTPEIKIDGVDADGAIRETAAHAEETLDADGDTRLEFLKKAGLAGGAVMGGGALLGALVPGTALAGKGRPPKSFGKGDIGILNYALTLEYLEAAFYIEAQKNNRKKRFLGKDGEVFLKTVVRDEKAHVKALKAALGKKAVKEPKFDFGNTTRSEGKFIRTAYALENTGVGAYIGQAFNIKEKDYLAAALSIVTIEARHSGAVALIAGDKIAPNGPFDEGLTAKKVLKIVKETGFIKG
jgi:rubrerythrin